MLSAHFTLDELTRSDTATRLGIDNHPSDAALDNIKRLAALLDTAREVLGQPILISSGYRSAAINTLVGGSKNSAHKDGRAADFTCPEFGRPLAICQALLVAGLPFDQMIHEGRWVHLAIPPIGHAPRRETLTAIFTSLGVSYRKGLF